MGSRLLAPGLAILGLALPARSAEVDLSGTWHVLTHYKDSAAANADAERWEDRVWVFASDGNGLRWTEYPIVFFEDQSGRFEHSGGNRAARVVHFWEPNPAQLAELDAGPRVNSRGSRSKKLRGSDTDGWRSSARSTAASASVITFTAHWSIEGLPAAPLFRQDDVLGSGLSEAMEGRTEYRTEVVEESGDVLRGRYQRDGTRIGSFQMRRTPGVRGLGTEEEQRARVAAKSRQRFLDLYGGGLVLIDADALSPEMVRRAQAGELPQEDRQELQRQIRSSIEEQVRLQGSNPNELRPQIETLSRRVEALLLEGTSIEEIQRMLAEGRLRP
jgi:hypothetical protein